MLCSVVGRLEGGWSAQEVERNAQLSLVFLSSIFRALATSCMLCSRAERSQDFCICFMIKNPLNSHTLLSIF